jgi:hypothetical protein
VYKARRQKDDTTSDQRGGSGGSVLAAQQPAAVRADEDPNVQAAIALTSSNQGGSVVVLKMPNIFGSRQGQLQQAAAAAQVLQEQQLLQQQQQQQQGQAGVSSPLSSSSISSATINDASNVLVKQQLSTAQLAKLKQFLQQCVISKALQAKKVAGLVLLHEALQVPMPGFYNALYPILVFEYFEVRRATGDDARKEQSMRQDGLRDVGGPSHTCLYTHVLTAFPCLARSSPSREPC